MGRGASVVPADTTMIRSLLLHVLAKREVAIADVVLLERQDRRQTLVFHASHSRPGWRKWT